MPRGIRYPQVGGGLHRAHVFRRKADIQRQFGFLPEKPSRRLSLLDSPVRQVPLEAVATKMLRGEKTVIPLAGPSVDEVTFRLPVAHKVEIFRHGHHSTSFLLPSSQSG